MLAATTLLPAASLRRLERAYVDALGATARADGGSVRHLEGARRGWQGHSLAQVDEGLGLLRALAAAPDTRDPRGNPYLRLVRELPVTAGHASAAAAAALLRAMRPVLVTAFAYAVPTDAVLARIAADAAAGGIVEVGAGGAYWARCLTDRGARVTAFDRVLPLDQVRPGGRLTQHHPVAVGGPVEALAAAPDADTLLLCWPPGLINRDEAEAGAAPVFSPMGMEALDRFAGPRLVFIGDMIGSFGSPAFFARLERELELEARLPLPNLGSWTDAAYFYRRRRRVAT